MRPIFLAVPIAVLLVASVASGREEPLGAKTDRTWTLETVSPGQLLEVRLLTGAGLKITAWDRNEVSVVSDWTEERCRDARIGVSRTTEGVLLETRYPTGHDRMVHNCSFTIEVRVPQRFDVRLRSAGGGVEIAGVNGTIAGQTGGGGIELDRVRGRVQLKTGGGSIRVSDSDLDGYLMTGGGDVKFDNVSGPVTARSGSVRGVVRGRTRSQ